MPGLTTIKEPAIGNARNARAHCGVVGSGGWFGGRPDRGGRQGGARRDCLCRPPGRRLVRGAGRAGRRHGASPTAGRRRLRHRRGRGDHRTRVDPRRSAVGDGQPRRRRRPPHPHRGAGGAGDRELGFAARPVRLGGTPFRRPRGGLRARWARPELPRTRRGVRPARPRTGGGRCRSDSAGGARAGALDRADRRAAGHPQIGCRLPPPRPWPPSPAPGDDRGRRDAAADHRG